MTDLFGLTSSSAVLSPCINCPPGQRDDCRATSHRPWRYERHPLYVKASQPLVRLGE